MSHSHWLGGTEFSERAGHIGLHRVWAIPKDNINNNRESSPLLSLRGREGEAQPEGGDREGGGGGRKRREQVSLRYAPNEQICTRFGEEGHGTRSLVKGSRPRGSRGNKPSNLFSLSPPISCYGSPLAEPNLKLEGWGSHSRSPHKSTFQGPEQRREVWSVYMEGQSASTVADSMERQLLPFSHPSSCREHGWDDGRSCRNQENGSHLAIPQKQIWRHGSEYK